MDNYYKYNNIDILYNCNIVSKNSTQYKFFLPPLVTMSF